jgi:hypothetical protein
LIGLRPMLVGTRARGRDAHATGGRRARVGNPCHGVGRGDMVSGADHAAEAACMGGSPMPRGDGRAWRGTLILVLTRRIGRGGERSGRGCLPGRRAHKSSLRSECSPVTTAGDGACYTD